jgi:hypothetical protein
MQLKTIALATAFALTGSFAFAQVPVGSEADRGNGALINRGPDPTVHVDQDSRPINRSRGTTVGSAPSTRNGMRRDKNPVSPATNGVGESTTR